MKTHLELIKEMLNSKPDKNIKAIYVGSLTTSIKINSNIPVSEEEKMGYNQIKNWGIDLGDYVKERFGEETLNKWDAAIIVGMMK